MLEAECPNSFGTEEVRSTLLASNTVVVVVVVGSNKSNNKTEKLNKTTWGCVSGTAMFASTGAPSGSFQGMQIAGAKIAMGNLPTNFWHCLDANHVVSLCLVAAH